MELAEPVLQTDRHIVPENLIFVGHNSNMITLTVQLSALAVVSVFFIYKFIIYPAFISPLSKIPNAHWTTPFFPAWILLTRARCRENASVHAAHVKFGPVVRLGPSELSVNDLNGVKTVYGGGFDKGQWYSIFDNYGYAKLHASF